jgi:hypothetical protein
MCCQFFIGSPPYVRRLDSYLPDSFCYGFHAHETLKQALPCRHKLMINSPQKRVAKVVEAFRSNQVLNFGQTLTVIIVHVIASLRGAQHSKRKTTQSVYNLVTATSPSGQAL